MKIDFNIDFKSRITGDISIDSYEAVGEVGIKTAGRNIFLEDDFPILDIGIEISNWDERSRWVYSPEFMEVTPAISFVESGSQWMISGYNGERSIVEIEDLRVFKSSFLDRLRIVSGYEILNGSPKFRSL